MCQHFQLLFYDAFLDCRRYALQETCQYNALRTEMAACCGSAPHTVRRSQTPYVPQAVYSHGIYCSGHVKFVELSLNQLACLAARFDIVTLTP